MIHSAKRQTELRSVHWFRCWTCPHLTWAEWRAAPQRGSLTWEHHPQHARTHTHTHTDPVTFIHTRTCTDPSDCDLTEPSASSNHQTHTCCLTFPVLIDLLSFHTPKTQTQLKASIHNFYNNFSTFPIFHRSIRIWSRIRIKIRVWIRSQTLVFSIWMNMQASRRVCMYMYVIYALQQGLIWSAISFSKTRFKMS